MSDEEKQPTPQFPQFPQGLQVAHPRQQGPLNKMISKALKGRLALKSRTGIKTSQTVKFGHRKTTKKRDHQTPYY